ncbi:hypothetical protein CCMA1212_002510 [Trichoderma ghanense]|uniref:Secreted protein n=1 Tax=Trichoderma ghanense TaxID=65468 RepID=A0ABY2HAV5_9HYPO
MASPRLRLLRNRDRPRARLSSASLSLAFCCSCWANASRSDSSRRTFFGLNLPVEAAARAARADVAPLRTVDAAGCDEAPCSAPDSGSPMVASGAALPVDVDVDGWSWLWFESSASVCDRDEAAAPPLRTPLAVVLPRTMLCLCEVRGDELIEE